MHHSFNFNAELESIVSITVKLSTSDLKVKFDGSAVQELLKIGKKESIVITGQLADGTWFGGEDRIRVIKEEE